MITTDLDRLEYTGSADPVVFRSDGTDIPIRDISHIKVYVTTTGTFTADFGDNQLDDSAHGHTVSQEITLSSSGVLPTGLIPSTTYFVLNPTLNSDDSFQVSLTASGDVVEFSDAGSGTLTWTKTVLKAITTDYTVSLVGTTATIDWVTGKVPGASDKVLFLRDVTFEQTTDLQNNSPFEAESLEGQLDLMVNMSQQLKNTSDRQLKFSNLLEASDATEAAATLTATSDGRKNKVLKFDSLGNIGVAGYDRIKVVDESTSTSCFPLFVTAATGEELSAKSGTNLTFNSNTGALTATSFVGTLTSANSVDSDQYVDRSIDAVHIATGAITANELGADCVDTSEIKDNSIVKSHLTDDTVGTHELEDRAVTAPKIALATIVDANITDGTITGAKLATGTIGAAQLGADCVDSSELVNGSVDLSHMSVNSIDSDQYVDGSIDTAHIADDAITTAKIATNAITANELAANCVAASEIVDGSIGDAHFQNGTITGSSMATNTITATQINANAITASELADDAVDTSAILNDAVTYVKLQDLGTANRVLGSASTGVIGEVQVTGDMIASETILAGNLGPNCVAGSEIVDNSIVKSHLTNDTVGTDELINDNVTYAKIQNVSATDRILGRDSVGAGDIEEITPANLLTMLGKGISDGNVLTANDAVADNDYLQINGTEVEGRTYAEVRSDLGIEAGATADQSNAEIRTAVEAASDSNVFTDADHSKLNAIEASATADQTQADINGLAITTVGTLTALTGGTGDFNWDSNTLTVDSSESRVGIGTASPTQLLHIHSAAAAHITTHFADATTSALGLGWTSDPAGGEIGVSRAGSEELFINARYSGSKIKLQVAASNKMTILADGKVGIGTTSPTHLLTVDGTVSNKNPGCHAEPSGTTTNMAEGSYHGLGFEKIHWEEGDVHTHGPLAANSTPVINNTGSAGTQVTYFTAPATGVYIISFSLNLATIVATSPYVEGRLWTTNKNYPVLLSPNGDDHVYDTIGLTVAAQMDENDTAFIRFFSDTTATATIDFRADSHFTIVYTGISTSYLDP